MKYRLLVIDSHPIQYRAPLFNRLARHPDIDLSVYYYSRQGAIDYFDPGFQVKVRWDNLSLEGHQHKFVKSYIFSSPANRLCALFSPELLKGLSSRRYDAVILCGYFFLMNWFLPVISKFFKIPVIFAGETVLFQGLKPAKRIFLKLFFNNIKAFLYIGTKSLEFYQHLRLPRERLFFLPYSVDNDFFISETERFWSEKERIKKDAGIACGMPVILYASKLIPRKRPQDLLYAFSQIEEKAALVFIGDGIMREELENYAHKNTIKNVYFLGFKNQSELPRYYALADIFVLPSAYEPWGLAVNEAMCAGLPIITTDKVAAAYDLVKDSENGFILKPGDIQGLKNRLLDLIQSEAKRKKMGIESLKIISNWSYDGCVKGIAAALEFSSKKGRPS